MKNIFLLTMTVCMLMACSKSDTDTVKLCDTELSCTSEQCLFTLDNEQGVTTFLNCYDAWSIRVPDTDGGGIWYIVDEWDEEFKSEDNEVTFCGYVRENTRPLILPDPMPGTFYQIKLEDIEMSAQ